MSLRKLCMVDTIAHMQGEIGSRSTRRPHADPIADLAVRFLNLELMTIGAQRSKDHEDGVLCVIRSKGGRGVQVTGPDPARDRVHICQR